MPYWVFPGEHHIERVVPTLPLSREIGRLAALRKSVAAYRIVIGQPRQDDLLQWLGTRYSEEELARLQEELRIDLAPPPASVAVGQRRSPGRAITALPR